MSERFAIVSRPGFTVRTKDGKGYCADNLACAHFEQRWCLTFISSGAMIAIPVADVESVAFNMIDGNHCNHCDEQLKSWPANEEADFVRWVQPSGHPLIT